MLLVSQAHEYARSSFRVEYTVDRLLDSFLEWTLAYNSLPNSLKIPFFNSISSVQFSCSVMSDSLQPHRLQHVRRPCTSPTLRACSNSSIQSVMPSNHLILCHTLPLLPSIFPSIRDFSNESVLCIRWPMYRTFSFIISPSNEYSRLISFRTDWFDLLAVHGKLKHLCQHHNSEASILRHSTFFIVQLSHPYVTTRKTIALTRCTFVDKVMFLLFNMLSNLVIAFLPRSKCLLISCLQSPSAVILETKKLSLSLFPLFPHLFPMK